MLKMVIFDFDGVIVDSEPMHYAAYQEVLKPSHITFSWKDYVEIFMGFDDRDAFRAAFERAGRPLPESELADLIRRKGRVFRQSIETHGVKAYPGVVELMRALAARVPVGLCSGALRADVDPVLAKLKVADPLSAIVTADDAKKSKPDPESYVLCVRRLAERFPDRGLTAANGLAIEDTPAGIEAATRTGLKVLAVTNSYAAERLAGAARIVPSLADVTVAEVERLVAG